MRTVVSAQPHRHPRIRVTIHVVRTKKALKDGVAVGNARITLELKNVSHLPHWKRRFQ